MDTVFLQKSTEKLQLKEGQLIRSENGEPTGVYPVRSTEQILVYGNGQITTQALKACLKEGIRVVYFNQYGKYLGRLEPDYPRNISRRLRQYGLVTDQERRLAWSKSLIKAKLHSAIVELRRLREQKIAFPYKTLHKSLLRGMKRLEKASNLEELRGVEGLYAREYYSVFAYALPRHLKWKGREYHPAPDPVNALLSMVYGSAAHELRNLFEQHSLDHQCGFLHEPGYQGGGLAYDLLEVVRACVCDHFVIRLLNRKEYAGLRMDDGGEPGGEWCKTVWEEFRKHLDLRYAHQTRNIRELLQEIVREYLRCLDDNGSVPDFMRILPQR